MAVITFDEIRERLARHQANEAQRNTPKAVARRAVYELASAMDDLSTADRAEILQLLRDEVHRMPAAPSTRWCFFCGQRRPAEQWDCPCRADHPICQVEGCDSATCTHVA